MPSKSYKYDDGTEVEIHRDGSFTIKTKDGSTYSFDKKGNCTVKKPGRPPKVIKGDEKKKGRKWVFVIDGKKWTVTIRDNEVEIEKGSNELPSIPEGSEKFNKNNGDRQKKGPMPDDKWSDPEKPKESKEYPDDPEYDPNVSWGGGREVALRRRGKSKAKGKRRRKA